MVEEIQVDLPTLLVIGARCAIDEVVGELDAAGAHDLRPRYGFLFAQLREGDLSIGDLAQRLEVSPQAASKLAEEMEARGLVRKVPDPADGRRRLLQLTERAREAMAEGRRARAAVERRLREACGEADLAAARRVLEELVGWRGGPIEALARRAKPIW